MVGHLRNHEIVYFLRGRIDMGRMKEYMMEIEDLCVEAIENGAVTDDDVYQYVNSCVDVKREDVSFVLEGLSGY